MFDPPLPAATRLFKYYMKGKFIQPGAGADAKSNTHEYKALHAILYIPQDNTLRTSPAANMYVLEDLTTLANGGGLVSALPGLAWRGASG